MRGAVVLALLAGPAVACDAPDRLPGTGIATADGAISTASYADPDPTYGHGILGRVRRRPHPRPQPRGRPMRQTHRCRSGPRLRGRGPPHRRRRWRRARGDRRRPLPRDARRAAGRSTPAPDTLRILAASPYIGRRHRWLAPAAIGDLDGDGHVEIAWIDRPHLAKVLRVWRYADGTFQEVAAASGLTNHAIGDAVIHGGLRDCGQGPQIVLSDAARARLLAVTFDGTSIAARDIGAFTPQTAARAVDCR